MDKKVTLTAHRGWRGKYPENTMLGFRKALTLDIDSVELNKKGIHDYGLALQVMDRGRKGLFSLRGMPENIEKYLLTLGLPDWFLGYLKQVKYLFPKGHCVAFLVIDLMHEWCMVNK